MTTRIAATCPTCQKVIRRNPPGVGDLRSAELPRHFTLRPRGWSHVRLRSYCPGGFAEAHLVTKGRL